MGQEGETYNINGDTVAGTIAAALKADRLLLLTDTAGVKGCQWRCRHAAFARACGAH